MLENNITIIISTFGSVLIGGVISYFLLDNYERKKYNTKIKAEIIELIAQYWANKLEVLGWKIENFDSLSDEQHKQYNHVLYVSNKSGMIMSGHLVVYISQVTELDKIISLIGEIDSITIKSNFNLSQEEYDQKFSILNEKFGEFYKIIRKLKIKI